MSKYRLWQHFLDVKQILIFIEANKMSQLMMFAGKQESESKQIGEGGRSYDFHEFRISTFTVKTLLCGANDLFVAFSVWKVISKKLMRTIK